MVPRMRARLRKYLPIVLVALVMQVLAPIVASWAAGIAAADPLQGAVICHNVVSSGAATDDQIGVPNAHAGACSICCLAQANASFDTPQPTFATAHRYAERVVWHVVDASAVPARGGFSAQARAPPQFS
jgi:hypothetical protein